MSAHDVTIRRADFGETSEPCVARTFENFSDAKALVEEFFFHMPSGAMTPVEVEGHHDEYAAMSISRLGTVYQARVVFAE